jgi:hypothetical protein
LKKGIVDKSKIEKEYKKMVERKKIYRYNQIMKTIPAEE